MLETFGRDFLAFGPPVILLAGTAVTVAVALRTSGPARRWALVAGPALTLGGALAGVQLVVTFIQPVEGSGFLLGGATIALYVLALTAYYPVLAGVVLWRRVARRERGAADPSEGPR